jgi:hypothetical protein
MTEISRLGLFGRHVLLRPDPGAPEPGPVVAP